MLRVNQLYGFGARRAAAGSTDPYWANVTLLMGFEGADASTTFTDESASANACTAVGDAQIDTSFFKFGASAGLLDGNDKVTVGIANDADFAFGTGDFSVELWMRPQRTDGWILGCAENNTFTGWWMYYDATTLNFRAIHPAGTLVSKTWSPSNGTWYFLQAIRTSGTFELAVDGVSLGTGAMADDIPCGQSNGLALGSAGDYFGGNLIASLDELRITKGVARAIALPTAAFPRS